MAAPSENYIDPAIAADSGTGTIGDPFGDAQYALNNTSQGAGGDRFNIKAGTDEILAASLSLATYGTPVPNAPLVFQGYTSAQGDGGIGGIDGNASFTMVSGASLDNISFIDMHLHNSGAADVINLDNFISLENCEIDGGLDGIDIDNSGSIINCYIHNCSGNGINAAASTIAFNYLKNGASDFSPAAIFSGGSHIFSNIININGSTHGIQITGISDIYIRSNSVFSSAGTGKGIVTSTRGYGTIINNICEGFSGIGGVGIQQGSAGNLFMLGFNVFFNNTTNLNNIGDVLLDLTANDQILIASPFLDAASQDFRVTTIVKALAYLTDNYPGLSVRSFLDIGALQREEGAVVVVPPVGVSLGQLYNVPAEDRIYEVLLS